MCRFFCCVAALVALLSARADELPNTLVPIPQGETALTDIGLYRVGWQSYGQLPAVMPVSWTGHFDPACGISYKPWGRVLGRNALLMHSPWRVPPGKTWVDYQLELPRVTPIRLSFGIAMGPDVAVPGKSDGVTFSCFLNVDDHQQELMRQHYDKASWLDHSFDLSAYAGKTITLRLQVEPGPKNNASWDYSFFGDAKITVGNQTPPKSELLKKLTSAHSYRATLGSSRTALSNAATNGVTPSNLLPYRNSIESSGQNWLFTYKGADCKIVYTYSPATGTLDDFTAQVDDGTPFQPAIGGEATVSFSTNKTSAPEFPVRGGKPIKIQRNGDTVNVLWEYEIDGRLLRLVWDFRCVAKALVVSVRCDEPVATAFSLGTVAAPLRQTLTVPYLDGTLHYLAAQNVFACRWLDWTRSQSSSCPQFQAIYDQKTDGTRNCLFETGYIAVSPDVDEVLPNLPNPRSPFLSVLAPRIMLDIWGHHRDYAGDAAKLRELKDNGIDHIAIIQHDWQHFGYDVKLPDHLPANPAYGGDKGLIAFGRAANDCGYIWSLHENYIDLYPDAPSYAPDARVFLSDGSPSKAWYNPGTKVQSFGLKSNRALEFARQNSPEVHRRYATTAAYLDVHPCVPPWHQLDHEAGQPMAAMEQAKVRNDTELFQFERDTHGGPLFGEGANHFYWAGRCDGVEAQVASGEDHSPFLDFDLLKIHPQMVNHGMGYYERWYRRGYDVHYGFDAGSVEQWDKYRAMEIAYGHAGFLGHILVHNVQAVAREHHLMHPVQSLYGTSQPVEIRYDVDGKLVTASAALIIGDTSRQCVRYENGLTVWINWGTQPWIIKTPGKTYTLPQWGFLALGPKTEVSTALQGGKIADYAECPEYIFADARTWFNLPYVRGTQDIEPRLRDFKYLGGNRVEVAYEWIVNSSLDTDYHCFVHATHPDEQGADRIVTQGDHNLRKPTSQWRPGDVIVDSPHQLTLDPSQTNYNLVIGLWKDNRVPLKGVEMGDNRILIAQLNLRKQADQVTDITAEKISHTNAPKVGVSGATQADFTAHTNPSGTWVDFGKLATDGAVKIDRAANRLVLFPYPREKKFRVSLSLKDLIPNADVPALNVHALAEGTQEDLGAVPISITNGRLDITFGMPKAGRYVISW